MAAIGTEKGSWDMLGQEEKSNMVLFTHDTRVPALATKESPHAS